MGVEEELCLYRKAVIQIPTNVIVNQEQRGSAIKVDSPSQQLARDDMCLQNELHKIMLILETSILKQQQQKVIIPLV